MAEKNQGPGETRLMQTPENLFPTEEESQDYCFQIQEYEIIQWHRNVSRWEMHCHVRDVVSRKEYMLVHLNKPAYLASFRRTLESADPDRPPEETEKQVEKEFAKTAFHFLERYQRIMAMDPHPVFPKVHDVHGDQYKREVYAALEYFDGKPFLQFAAGLNTLQILGLFKELAEGLAWLHGQGLLHRRIKSENIFGFFEKRKPRARFVTWGLAIPENQAQVDRGGSPPYTAPEVLLDGKITSQSDLWSLGSLLYRALTGEEAFPERSAAHNLKELRNIVRHEQMPNPPGVYKIFQDLSPKTAEIIKVERIQELLFGLLHPDPQQRPLKTAIAILKFLKTHWPQISQGAPETGDTISISI